MKTVVRVAAAQVEVGLATSEANLDRGLDALSRAAGQGAELVVLPELLNCGYPPPGDRPGRTAYLRCAEPLDGPFVSAVRAHAVRLGLHVVVGIAERSADVLHNSSVLVEPSGRVNVHRKVHLPRLEATIFEAGDRFTSFATDLGRIGMLVCADNSFPESARILMLGGAELVAVSYLSANTCPTPLYASLTTARAYENQVFVVAANGCGATAEPAAPLRGESSVAAPTGALLATLGAEPGLAVADLHGDLLSTSRALHCRRTGRRPAVYGSLVTEALEG